MTSLKSADLSVISMSWFDGLADGLVKRASPAASPEGARRTTRAQGATDPAFEAEKYASASYQRLREIAGALAVQIKNDILLPVAPGNFGGLIDKLRQVGLDRDFLLGRLLPSADAAHASGEVPSEDNDTALTAKAGAILERVFGWTRDNIFGVQALQAPRFAAGRGAVRDPAGRAKAATSLYAAYANYLVVVALKGARSLPKAEVPIDPQQCIVMPGATRGDRSP